MLVILTPRCRRIGSVTAADVEETFSDLNFGTARMYHALSEVEMAGAEEVRVFRDPEEARRWFGVEPVEPQTGAAY